MGHNTTLKDGIELKLHCNRCEEHWSITPDDIDVAHCPWCDGDLADNWDQYSGQGYDFRSGK